VVNGVGTGYMVVTPAFVRSFGSGQPAVNNATFVLGHELQHLFDEAGVTAADAGIDQQLVSYYTNPANSGSTENVRRSPRHLSIANCRTKAQPTWPAGTTG
jgi:hypothetical protein